MKAMKAKAAAPVKGAAMMMNGYSRDEMAAMAPIVKPPPSFLWPPSPSMQAAARAAAAKAMAAAAQAAAAKAKAGVDNGAAAADDV